ncbi:hypothetical protein OHD62_21945 [Mesorhizobium sp. YC-39]|uniref:hypothetical protein n=1 Tax=unclassified Mesorhizobium TaxID=325217 RepID=UPI0021E950B6|nr:MULTISPECIES: hypothetical protein [unclassified Mesorhizobium]MCV3210808.1 hypothetical protein [Mesorhizobium sp. YC-2]MCV3231042.1 hypothetical protein [Mesorhizobium sp. YC-39]
MRHEYSAQLREDLNVQVLTALHSQGIVNVAVVAEEVRRRNLAENIALEDIEHLVMQTAQFYAAPMEFDGLTVVMETSGALSDVGLLHGNGSLEEEAAQLDPHQMHIQ